MKEYGLPEPEFLDMEIALRINLYRAQVGNDTKVKNNIDTETNTETSKEISKETSKETGKETGKEKNTRNMILSELKHNPVITQKQLARKVGLSYSGIRYAMKQMQDEGILKRTGSTKKGQWIIQENRND